MYGIYCESLKELTLMWVLLIQIEYCCIRIGRGYEEIRTSKYILFLL